VGDLVGAEGATAAGMLGQPKHPGSIRRGKRSADRGRRTSRAGYLTLGPSNSLLDFSTASHASGGRRRPARPGSGVKAFLLHEELLARLPSHSCGDTIGVCSLRDVLSGSNHFSLLVAFILLDFRNRPRPFALRISEFCRCKPLEFLPVDPAPAAITAALAMHAGTYSLLANL